MATYIGFNTTLSNSISVRDLHYVVDPSGISRSLVLLQGNPYSINGTNYVVYMIGGAGTHNLTSSWFVHLHNDDRITSTSNLPLDSQIIYATSNNVAFSPVNAPSGRLYLFSTTVQIVNPSNTWRTDINPGSVAGTSHYTYYNKQTSTVSSGKCTNYDFCPTSSYGVSIVELYHNTHGVANATGLYTSIINRSAGQSSWPTGTYKSWIYDYKRTSNTGSSYPARINGTGRKVFAIHNTKGGDCNLAIAYGGSTSTALSDTNYTIGSFGYTRVAYNTWAHHTTEGKHYYSITVNKHDQFIETKFQLGSSKTYKIKMHTYSEAGIDGIVISKTKLTSASLSSSSTDGITRCSGVDKTVTYTLKTSSSAKGTSLYIYFKTDLTVLKGPGDVDSTGASINNSTISNYSTGDIEIENVYSIRFDANGGTGGTEVEYVPVGESLDLSTITKPTRSGWSFYRWSVGDTGFNFAPSLYTPSGNVTLYAVWDNYPKFTELSDKSVYCTSSCEEASSTQGITFIPLFSGDGMTCSEGSVKYVDNKSKVYPVGSPNSPISGATIKPIGPNSYVKVPSGTPAGNYIASIVVYTSASVSTPGSYYGPTSNTPETYQIPFTIKATALTYGPVELIQHTPDDIIEGNITQQKNFPAGSFTISSSTIGDYFSLNGVFRQVVSCNNGRVREGNLNVYGWLPGPYFSDIVVPSLGTTQTNTTTYTFANNDNEALYYGVEGEGYKSFVKYVRSGVREANSVTSLSASVGESSIYAGDKTFLKTKALFTSGDKVSVRGTYSGYDSSIINIDNNVTVICVNNVPDEGDFALEYSKIYYYYGQYNDNYLFKKMWEDGPGSELTAEYIVTDTNDFDILLHASYEYNGSFTTPTHIVGRLNEDMSDYGYPVDEVKIIDVY